MPLELHELPPSEYIIYTKVCWEAFKPGLNELLYPNGQSDETQQHMVKLMKHSKMQYPDRYKYLKVVDTDLPDSDPLRKVIGVSQWRLFPTERSEEQMKQEEEASDNFEKEIGPIPERNRDVEEILTRLMDGARKRYIGRSAHVLLQAIGTRPAHYRRGVGALHMKWGTEKADELALPAHLEGSRMGRPLYEKWGFEVLEAMPFDARDYGYHIDAKHWVMKRPAKAEGGQMGVVSG